MNKLGLIMMGALISVAAKASVKYGEIAQSTHTWTSDTHPRTAANSEVSDPDTLQTTPSGKLVWEQKYDDIRCVRKREQAGNE